METEKLLQPLFDRYSHYDILSHYISKFVGRAYEWWENRQSKVEKERKSIIRDFYELRVC